MPITRRKTLTSAVALLGSAVLSGFASAEDDLASKPAQTDERHDMPDLKNAEPKARLREIRHTGRGYVVKTASGDTLSFGERDILFKTDASLKGPLPGQPVLVPTGKRGDRICIVFAAPEDMIAFVTCNVRG